MAGRDRGIDAGGGARWADDVRAHRSDAGSHVRELSASGLDPRWGAGS